MKLSIGVKNYPNLSKKIRDFYGETLRIAQKQGRPPTFQDAKKNWSDIIKFLKGNKYVSFLKQPIVNEWVGKGWKSITYKNWHFAVELVDEKNGIIVDCVHNSMYYSLSDASKDFNPLSEAHRKILSLMYRLT